MLIIVNFYASKGNFIKSRDLLQTKTSGFTGCLEHKKTICIPVYYDLNSEDLDELLCLSDRLAVIYEGRLVSEIPVENADIRAIGLMMAGTKVDA